MSHFDKGSLKELEIPLSHRFLHKSRPDIAWNSCSRQVYPITLDARLIIHEITQLFRFNSCFHALEYVESRHHAFPLGGPAKYATKSFENWNNPDSFTT